MTTPSTSARMHYGYIIVACCCLIMGVDIGLTFSCAGIFYRPVSESLGVSVGSFGIYMSIMYITSTLMLPYAGRLIERYSARWLLTCSSALMGRCLSPWLSIPRSGSSTPPGRYSALRLPSSSISVSPLLSTAGSTPVWDS